MSNSKRPKFYTTGYTGKNVLDLTDLLTALDAILVDVRYSPNSRSIVWRKDYLKLLLKEKYRHVVQLGNRSFRENKITIQNLELGIKTAASFGINIILMCGCEDLRRCHRFIIASELRQKGYEVEELESWSVAQTSLF